MTLRDYLSKKNMTARQFAGLIGWSDSKISRVLNGITDPDLSDLRAVAMASKGAVQPNDWLHKELPAKAAA
jgi:transcriptional regulator with XRE-family HTH domain